MSATALVPATGGNIETALIKAIGFDKVPAEQRQLAMHIAERYGLDLMLRHIVMVDGKPYITRDGLLHVAHRSGVFDGIEVSDPELGDTHWTARATVYRKDMTRGFTYSGRYPKTGGNARFAPEMAVKVAEVMALRRAFDVSAPVIEERWDLDEVAPPAPREPVSLAAKAAAGRARIEERVTPATEAEIVAAQEAYDAGGPFPLDVALRVETPAADPQTGEVQERGPMAQCDSKSDSQLGPEVQCRREFGHTGSHKTADRSWPNA